MSRRFPDDLTVLDVLCSCFEKNETFDGGWIHRVVPFASPEAAEGKYNVWVEDLRVMLLPSVEVTHTDDPAGHYQRATFTSDEYPNIRIKQAGAGIALWVSGQSDVMGWWMGNDLWRQDPHPTKGLYRWD